VLVNPTWPVSVIVSGLPTLGPADGVSRRDPCVTLTDVVAPRLAALAPVNSHAVSTAPTSHPERPRPPVLAISRVVEPTT